MRPTFRHALAFAGVTMLLAGGCSSKSDDTTAAAGASTSAAPAATTTLAPATTAGPTTTVAAAPVIAEAAGWRLVVKRPVTNGPVGPVFDICYELSGPAQGPLALDVTLISAPTNSQVGNARANAAIGAGSARISITAPDFRFYDLTVQALLNGQPVDKLAVRFPVRTTSDPPAGCP